ncbi:MAG TPA: hypothetical protein VFE09_01285 [Rubrobacteraceae bacterium]|nr:hypothetical protein [Rubrobacteraceae bacterium]
MSEVWYPGLGKEEDDTVQRVHGLPGRAHNEQTPLDVAGVTVDLQDRACPHCREVWLPWQRICPRDGSRTIPASELPSLHAPPQLRP